ncbi:MAG: DinB family protein [Longimicrobiales bacterium]
MDAAEQVRRALGTVLRELIDGAAPDAGWSLNPGDRGLLASLDMLSAEAASARPNGRTSIAAHVDHLRYGLELLNRWAQGEKDPFSDADYSTSWQRQTVSEADWQDLRQALARQARLWLNAIEHPRDLDDVELTGMLASAVHLAYHLGAIRQVDAATSGPAATR